ncbi:alpha-L-fucosidase, partial [bacterium]|nr:alpha-L-fucosidase [bacterium]
MLVLFFLMTPAQAQTSYQPTSENLAARRWFQDAKFGLFIHWGVYSVLGEGEWVMNIKHSSFAYFYRANLIFCRNL